MLKSLPPDEQRRVLDELRRFAIIAHDRVKPNTIPPAHYFLDSSAPQFVIYRRDAASPETDLSTPFTSGIDVSTGKYVTVGAGIQVGNRFDNIWQKRTTIYISWKMQEGQSVNLGVAGITGANFNWRNTITLKAPSAKK